MYPTLTETSLLLNYRYYSSVTWLGISPTPCYTYNISNPQPQQYSSVYYGTVALQNQTLTQYFNIYGDPFTFGFEAFDSLNHNLKAFYYSNGGEDIVENWNPNTPAPSVFQPPIGCFNFSAIQSTAVRPNPLGPTFPTSFTMYVYNDFDEVIYYYDGANQRWRIDDGVTSLIQNGNTQYLFLNSNNQPQLVSPLPCYTFSQNYTFIPDFPASLGVSLGTAMLNGQTLAVWGGSGQIWYWDSTNTPKFYFGETAPSIVSFFQPGAPPAGVFDPPAMCIPSPTNMSGKRSTTTMDRRNVLKMRHF